LAAVIWALHPVQVESVAWISELKNVLSTFFYLLALLLWLDSDVEPNTSSYRLSGSFLMYLLALSAKTTACTLPIAMVICSWIKGKKLTFQKWLEVGFFMMVGMFAGFFCIWWENWAHGPSEYYVHLSVLESFLVASKALWFYIFKLLFPLPIIFSYPKWNINPHVVSQYSWPILCLGTGIFLWLNRYRWPKIVLAILFFVLTLSPLLGFIPLYTFRYTYVADHYQYLACAGPIALFAACLTKYFNSNKVKSFFPFVCAILIGMLGFLSWRQAHAYRNIEDLWQDTLRKNPNSSLAHNNWGIILAKNNKPTKAITEFEQAIKNNPDDEEAYYNLGVVLAGQNDLSGAASALQHAINIYKKELPPTYKIEGHLMVDTAFSRAYNHLGIVLAEENTPSKAIAAFKQSIKIDPDNAEACNNLGTAWAQQGNSLGAIVEFKEALKINPAYMLARHNLNVLTNSP